MRLRDLAGLIVIDFIDMEVNRNQGKVERALKDAMRSDRARIQIGRISPFGLLEMSRQRLRPSLHETSFENCPHCAGTGIRRSTESTALQMLRVLGEEAQRAKAAELVLYTPTAVALYLFNNKRQAIAEIESRYGITVRIEADDSLIPPDFRLERIKEDGGVETAAVSQFTADSGSPEEEGGKRRRRRRSRRRKRGGEDNETADQPLAADGEDVAEDADSETSADQGSEEEDGDGPKPKRRRRGRRGGRRRRRADDGEQTEQATDTDTQDADAEAPEDEDATVEADAESADSGEEIEEKEKKPRRRRARRSRAKKADDAAETGSGEDAPAEAASESDAEPANAAEAEAAPEPEEKPKRRGRRRKAAPKETDAEASASDTAEQSADVQTIAIETPEPAADPAPEPAPEPAPQVRDAEAEQAAAEAAKTTVIEVGSEGASSERKGGWWDRPAE